MSSSSVSSPVESSPVQRGVSRPVALVVGLACVAAGVVLTVRPFTSLAVLVALVSVSMVTTGIAEFVEARAAGQSRWAVTLAVGWIVAGMGVLVWPGATLTVVLAFVATGMLLGGAVRIWTAIRGIRDDRITGLVSGAASIVFGVLALSWPDVTILVIAVVFGARTVLTGLALVFAAVFPDRAAHRAAARVSRAGRPPGLLLRAGRGARALAALVVALLLLSLSATLHKGDATVDAFYSAPKNVPAKPGQLLRSESFTRLVPDSAQAWRILYTTTRDDGRPALASAVVLVSRTAPAGPRPVIAWAHGTTGFARQCAPSLLKDPFGSGALPDLDRIIANGWVLVATDYTGLGTAGVHPYLIGQGEGRSVLDAVRAARQLREVSLSDKTVVWGHSQGGGAALWTGAIAPTYAPDVPLAGVAAMAPASDLLGLVSNLDNIPGGSIFASYVIAAYSGTYSDVKFDAYVRGSARAIVKKAAQRCLSEPSTLVSVATSLAIDKSVFSRPAAQGPFGQRLAQNTPRGIITAPLLLAQGGSDPLVLPSVQARYAKDQCAAGQKMDYRVYPGYDHVGVVTGNSPLLGDLITWTQDRLDGKPAQDTCASITG